MLAEQLIHLRTTNHSALPLQWLTIASSCWTVSESTACCLCSKVLLSVELPSSPWSWLTSWLCLSTSSWSCCFSLSNPCSSLPYRASSAKSLSSRKLEDRKQKITLTLSFTYPWHLHIALNKSIKIGRNNKSNVQMHIKWYGVTEDVEDWVWVEHPLI